ncbi:MAG: Nif11-like leader peptide family RiPP precursor [Cyanobacteriota bacterium]|nr:Nif11-like leader peptide family RiPP precursor [Cyanobacteriota bacterium]
MALTTLEAFLEAAARDPGLQEQLLSAPDAATLAAIAQAAGYPLREADWLAASAADRPEIAGNSWRSLAADPWQEDPVVPPSEAPAGSPPPHPPPNPPESGADLLLAFLHQAQGDPVLGEALAQAPDAAAVADLAQQAGFAISSADLWAASEATPEELGFTPPPLEPEADLSAGQAVLQSFLGQLEGDRELQQALTEAADAAAVALLAQAAGYPLREADLWLASGLEPQHLAPLPAPEASPAEKLLLAFLHQAQADALLQEALAEAIDAAAVAAIAQAAGYPISPAQLWAASGAEPEELVVPLLVIEA